MILAMALLGLSISILAQKICLPSVYTSLCKAVWFTSGLPPSMKKTISYSVFLGVYGIVVSAIGTVSLLVESIPTIVPLVGDGLGILFYLSGGIAWVVDSAHLRYSDNNGEAWANPYRDEWWLDVEGAYRRCEAEHGLVWALFAFTAGLAICDYFRRRDQVKSLR